ncbi:MAG TPA: hypothetical protein VGG39_17705 [Polyangiaceae bacterium]
MPPYPEEQLVPFPSTLSDQPEVTHCRGTLLVASRRTLRDHGHFERYRTLLAEEHETTFASHAAAGWIPIEAGVAHYRACDALDVPVDEQLVMGAAVVHSLQRTFLGTVLRAAGRGMGITPLFGMQKFFTIYGRSFRGGGGRLVRTGPKELRVEFVGNPVAAIRYFRIAYRGFIAAGCETFATRVVTAELDSYLSPTSMAYRIAWA